jgi:hypothetical protein
MTVDFHQHVWTPGFRRALEERTEPPFLRGTTLVLPVSGACTVDPDAYAPAARLAELHRSGLSRAVVSLPPTTEPTPDLVRIWHAEAAALDPRLVPLAYGEARDGFAGAIVAAPALLERPGLLDELQERGQLLFVHPGAVPGGPPWRAAGVWYTGQMLEAFAAWVDGGARRWPALRVVFALLAGGAPFQLERFSRRGLHPRAPFLENVWFETSSYGERALELTLQTFGAGRLLFGSDAPVDRVDEARGVLRTFGGALEVALLASNPLAVLGAEARRWAA